MPYLLLPKDDDPEYTAALDAQAERIRDHLPEYMRARLPRWLLEQEKLAFSPETPRAVRARVLVDLERAIKIFGGTSSEERSGEAVDLVALARDLAERLTSEQLEKIADGSAPAPEPSIDATATTSRDDDSQ